MSKITFSFGQNWKNYLKEIDDSSIESAKKDISEWLGQHNIQGKSVLDIGSGSGIHSYCFYYLGASEIFSLDYDINSVEATKSLWENAGKPRHWKVVHGSVLDQNFLKTILPADIVYSWGVLHHTGNMWEAIENAQRLVKAEGYFFISIYAKGPNYEKHLSQKTRFNESNAFGKWLTTWNYIIRRIIWRRIKKRQNPFTWNEKRARGMRMYHDVVDWLGGLPYEVAHECEITSFLASRGFKLHHKVLRGEGACHRLLYKRE